jgi:hypothetical protein
VKKNFIIMVSSLACSVVMFTGCLEKTASEYGRTGKPINYGLSEALLRFSCKNSKESLVVVEKLVDTLRSVLRIQRYIDNSFKVVKGVISQSGIRLAAQNKKIISSKNEPSSSTRDNPEQIDVLNIVPLHLFTSSTDKLVAKEIHDMSQEYYYKGISEASVYATPDEKCKKGLMYAAFLTKTLLQNLENSIGKFQVVQIANYLYSKVHAIKDTQDRHDVKRTKNTLVPHDSKDLAPRHRKVVSAMSQEKVKMAQRMSQELSELCKDEQFKTIQDENKYLLDLFLGSSNAPTLIRDIEYPLIFENNYTLYPSTEEVIAKLNNSFAQIYNGNHREIESKVIAGYGYPGIIRSILAVYRIIQNDLNVYKLKSTKPKLSKNEKRNSIKNIDKAFSENNKWPDDQEVYASESEDESDTGSVVINSDQESDDQEKNN